MTLQPNTVDSLNNGQAQLDLSIVIVNWNACELLKKCLQHIGASQTQAQYEIIVVDNNSSDGSQTMVKQDFPAVRLIENSDNAGFAGGNNQGMDLCQGRYVLLLNSDAFVHDDTLDTMIAFADAHPEAGMTACKLLYEDGSLQASCYKFPTLLTELFIALQLDKLGKKSRFFGQYAMTYWDFNDVRPVDAVMGAFMLLRREVIEQVSTRAESYRSGSR
jgi:GT2 family glycosyltransferase